MAAPSGVVVSIYVLVDPRDGEIRYVGWTNKSLKARLRGHLYDAKRESNWRAKWIRRLVALGLRPMIRLVQTVPSSAYAQAECYWIKHFRDTGCRLTNGTDGGDGNLGRKVSAETRARMSRALTGKTRTPEQRAEASAARKGKKLSQETRVAMSNAHTGKKRSAAHRAAVSAAQTGMKHSPERRATNSRVRMGKKPSLEAREAMSKAHTGKKLSPEQCAAISARQQGKKHTPEHRAATRASMTPERNAAISRALTGKKHSPERVAANRAGQLRHQAALRQTQLAQ